MTVQKSNELNEQKAVLQNTKIYTTVNVENAIRSKKNKKLKNKNNFKMPN